MRPFPSLLAAVTILAAVAPAHARTWRVERDGSGDFVVIQDAVDAASAGDVIQLGPGRFDEWEFRDGNPEYPVYVQVEKDLSFVGAGVGETIIGPTTVEVHPPNQYYVTGILIYGTDLHVSARDLTVENCRYRGVDLYRGRLELDHCEFRGCRTWGVTGIFVLGGWIRDCSFHDMGTTQSQAYGLGFYTPSVGVEVARCTFTNINGVHAGAWWSGCRDIDYRDCEFDYGIVGVGFHDGASGSVNGCAISDFSNYGIILNRCGTVVIEDNEITQLGDSAGAGIGVWYTAQNITMHQNVVVSDTWVLNIDANVISGEISDNHFLREGDQAWWVWTADYYPITIPRIINLENNYWGTTDTALLDQWIFDGNDDDDVDIYIDYLPLADGPIPTEPTTWSTVKAQFR